MEDVPLYPDPADPPFYEPYLAKVPPDSNDVQLMSLSNHDSHDLALSLSILWAKAVKCGGADADGSGDMDFADLVIMTQHWLEAGCLDSL